MPALEEHHHKDVMAEKILIIDDDLDTLRLVGLLLQRKGYQIVAADNGEQGISKAQQENPDLILLDVMMPDMDGVEVLRRLRARDGTSSTPIIMFTAKSQIEDKVTGFETGADDYLTKPTHPAELLARVRTILSRSAGKRTSGKPSTPDHEKGKIISVLSAKGGLGVSTIALNLSLTINRAPEHRAVVVELRPGFGSISLMLGVPETSALVPLLRKEADSIAETDLQNALVNHKSGLAMLLASYQPSDNHFQSAAEQMKAIVAELATMFTHVVVDLGPGLPESSAHVVEISNQVIVVIEPVMTTLKQTRALLDELSMKVLGLGAIQVVQVNRVRVDGHVPLREIQNELGHSVTATIQAEPELAYQAGEQGVALADMKSNGLIQQQMNKIAEAVAAG